MAITLIVVGCSGSTSGKKSPASSYLLQAPYEGRTYSLVLDLGPGAFGALYNYLPPSEVDAIALSHLHPDHCLDVCAFYVASKYSDPAKPWPQRPVYGPPGTAGRLAAAYDVPGSTDDVATVGGGIAGHFVYHDWAETQSIGPFEVRTARVLHSVEAYAIRVQESATAGDAATGRDSRQRQAGAMVYSGDTGPCEPLTELAAGVELLLVEAAYQENPLNPPGLHLTPREAAEAGQAAGVGTVVLTHVPPWHDAEAARAQAAPHFAGEVLLATPGMQLTIG